jgi:opacity protein-like surface antigen
MLLALAARSLHAQALPTASGPGSYVAVGGGVSAFQEDYGQQVIGGALIYVDANPTWRYGLEAEARYLRLHTDEQETETNYFAGVRVQLWKPSSRLRPYAKFLVGSGQISFPFHYATGSYFAYAPGAGLDIALGDRWTVRAADFEYQDWQNFTYGPMHPYGVSAGISFRINGVDRFPKNAYRIRK